MESSEKKNGKTREFLVLDDREHVLARSGMYIGGTKLAEREQWAASLETGKFEFRKFQAVPGLLKIFSEIVDNSVDAAIDSDFKLGSHVSVEVDEKKAVVEDDGPGIPVRAFSLEDARTLPEIAWTTLRSGTSFGEDREKIGTNGLGSVATNIFSARFVARSDDGKKRQTIECSDNMSRIAAGKIEKSSGKSGCRVEFEPDLERFGLERIDETHRELLRQRLVGLALSYPEMSFSFNGKKLSFSAKKFAAMFSDSAVVQSKPGATVVVFPNPYDEFRFYSQVNGIDVFRGGSHVDWIASELSSRVRDKLAKKHKNIRPGDVKSKIGLAVVLTGFKNPEFDSQSKESLKNSAADVAKHLAGKIDLDELAKQVLKRPEIVDPVVDAFKLKEELKARQQLRKAKKIRVSPGKWMGPVGKKKWLFLCEGQSAQSSLCSCLGRDGIGYYCCRGLPINCLDNSMQKIAANQEFRDVMSVLELDAANPGGEVAFEKIVIATDQDLDGIHLSSMLVGWFKRFAPQLFSEGRICKLQTPLVVVKDQKGRMKEWFFDLWSFRKWEESNRDPKLKIVYQKGLGSLERADVAWLVSKLGGFEELLYELVPDEDGFKAVDLWLSGESEQRKAKLRNYKLDVGMV